MEKTFEKVYLFQKEQSRYDYKKRLIK